MVPGAPTRLLPSFPLRRALALAPPGEPLGAWVRQGRWPVHLRAGGRALLVSPDLGWLLRRCARILVRDRTGPVVLESERLIAWRTLQIVVGTPFLPPLHELQALYPGLRVHEGRLTLPLGADGAEPALSACAAARVPVAATWIDYAGPPVVLGSTPPRARQDDTGPAARVPSG